MGEQGTTSIRCAVPARGLSAIGFSNIVGSGSLFAALSAAQIAGPAALVAWLVAGVPVTLVALVMVELGATRPEGGGTCWC